MSAGRRSKTATYAPTWKAFPAATLIDLVAESPDGASCARELCVPLGGDFTVLRDADGVNKPLTAVPVNYQHRADVSAANCTAAFIAFYGAG